MFPINHIISIIPHVKARSEFDQVEDEIHINCLYVHCGIFLNILKDFYSRYRKSKAWRSPSFPVDIYYMS